MADSKMAKAEPRYSLRESSKQTPRYREYIGEASVHQHHHHQPHNQLQDGHDQQQTQLHQLQPVQIQQSQNSRRLDKAVNAGHVHTPSKQRRIVQVSQSQQKQRREAEDEANGQGQGQPGSIPTQTQQSADTEATVNNRIIPVVVDASYEQSQATVAIGAEQQEEVSTSGYVQHNVPTLRPRTTAAFYCRNPLFERTFNTAHELSFELKCNLRKLKNVLKLPKARRFVFCEFFYSGVDQQIFLAENEFSQLMRESFPNLKCTKLRKPEWREIRRLIGKPRRCSQAFLDEEREALEIKRQKIRTIYNGSSTSLDNELIDLPAHLPRPPIVGQKIYARVRVPKDGIYAATVDAVTEDGYRVVFEKDEMIPPSVIKDFEVMFDQPSELLSINYFLEQNRANIRGSSSSAMTPVVGHYYPTSTGFIPATIDHTGKMVPQFGGRPAADTATTSSQAKKVSIAKDEKVGNFPVRMLVILVKLCKVMEYKKQLVGQLAMMNDTAEKMNLLGSEYPHEFKFQFSQLVLDLETINRLFRNYLAALQTHYNTLIPHLNEPQPTDRPEVLRKTCNTHAFQIVKHCNSELNVRNKRILHLITSLTSILIQLRTIGAYKKKFNMSDKNILGESLKQIHAQIAPNNSAAFQDYVEVHMKQILRMMSTKY